MGTIISSHHFSSEISHFQPISLSSFFKMKSAGVISLAIALNIAPSTASLRSECLDCTTSTSTQAPIDLNIEKKCFDVPFCIEKTCYREEITSIPYSCKSSFEEEFCRVVEAERPSTCHRLVNEEIQYECPKPLQKRLCSQIPVTVAKTCTSKESRKSPSKCPKKRTIPECEIVARPVEAECFQAVPNEQEYPCFGTETVTECDVKMDILKSKCDREIQTPVTFEKDEVILEKICS